MASVSCRSLVQFPSIVPCPPIMPFPPIVPCPPGMPIQSIVPCFWLCSCRQPQKKSDPAQNRKTEDTERCRCASNTGLVWVLHRFNAMSYDANIEPHAIMGWLEKMITWSYGVTASTLDSESSDRGSNPRRTCLFLFVCICYCVVVISLL